MIPTRYAILVVAMLLAACSPGAATPKPATPSPAASQGAATATPPAATASPVASTAATVCANLPAGSEGDLLATICQRGTIKMSTDPEYPPQSALAPGDPLGYKGFDIDVGSEIAKRLGVTLGFETPSWSVLTAGGWNGRWDFSVGSMTITSQREAVLDFTQPYYFTPAQMSVRSDSTISDLAGLAGKVICVAETTTYLDWLNGSLDFGSQTSSTPQIPPPAGATAFTRPTDHNCAEDWQAGRHDFEGWLSSLTTVQGAIDEGLPVKSIGDPVFFEPLAVAFDKSTPTHSALVAAANKIVGEMHADGTLTALSMKWFHKDFTVNAAQ